MKIAIAGGTGFVGKALTNYLLQQGHSVYILTRNTYNRHSEENITYVEWLTDSSNPEAHLSGINAFINFSGESLNSGRWTKERKQRIIDSRLEATREVNRILSILPTKPEVLLNASAIGIYGTSLEGTYTEETSQKGNDFLANTVEAWEKEAAQAEELGMRVCFLRLGVVLGKEGGALGRMVLPYRFFAGGTIGTGQQWLSWVHIDDVIRSTDLLLHKKNISGPVNLTAPNPMKMKNFGKTIGKSLGRPHWLPVPGFALKLLLGEMSILVLEGQRVLPQKLLENGYEFTYETANAALESIL
ncbi:TIGR01777 family oxidoreductase [Fredinandcohnia sp. 179-A 10B2 NHS]|uniref:TIGR01777 family oxidoreductase n=1 Tax=Fredinandcohnia sp. 179-A 10B2 NHS TaxID=3235176 RepID=UPI0039A10BE0